MKPRFAIAVSLPLLVSLSLSCSSNENQEESTKSETELALINNGYQTIPQGFSNSAEDVSEVGKVFSNVTKTMPQMLNSRTKVASLGSVISSGTQSLLGQNFSADNDTGINCGVVFSGIDKAVQGANLGLQAVVKETQALIENDSKSSIVEKLDPKQDELFRVGISLEKLKESVPGGIRLPEGSSLDGSLTLGGGAADQKAFIRTEGNVLAELVDENDQKNFLDLKTNLEIFADEASSSLAVGAGFDFKQTDMQSAGAFKLQMIGGVLGSMSAEGKISGQFEDKLIQSSFAGNLASQQDGSVVLSLKLDNSINNEAVANEITAKFANNKYGECQIVEFKCSGSDDMCNIYIDFTGANESVN